MSAKQNVQWDIGYLAHHAGPGDGLRLLLTEKERSKLLAAIERACPAREPQNINKATAVMREQLRLMGFKELAVDNVNLTKVRT